MLLGYGATGLEKDLTLPALLVQLESIQEDSRQGLKAKYQLQCNLSVVIRTDEQTTYKLIELSSALRKTLSPDNRLTAEVRKVTLNETQFDIAPNNGHLSFSDTALTIEAVF
ncbi:hypothetical protein [Endozoicomonas numazuensis]|uniref:Uncharacterized protein n=1 Tax=Endozoicomonas numazuensis TaxID=1137799 RepID=A0A081NFB0_9GAMM|nr:hypothetical protein [Endozoicomonas numazuensis]KEQ17133.1 hypothetical protein GZ78_14785 [Endozoicomonas numazuensis]